eukprot:CAMPEP_0177543014 /NCGR_PEP_ID=MMETSP0369-20130122/61136_1 /TAXON_ID=447022 ORGANISM="Scrippsiella hangoei-like, Strain SHHI-4" /NCGR_SAMPLE_ID=MMETSP0369 /ASSEMBLY_ACC=CAM_ASM_000364 /LENGTH=66 /DNA_ID=CAMNT_0019026767 /DNA_START=243 /DNA_END=440 /DNA_ORIENTATION=-
MPSENEHRKVERRPVDDLVSEMGSATEVLHSAALPSPRHWTCDRAAVVAAASAAAATPAAAAAAAA